MIVPKVGLRVKGNVKATLPYMREEGTVVSVLSFGRFCINFSNGITNQWFEGKPSIRKEDEWFDPLDEVPTLRSDELSKPKNDWCLCGIWQQDCVYHKNL